MGGFRWLAAAALLFLAACASGGSLSGPIQKGSNEALAARTLSDYKLGAGDQLRVTVYDEPSLSGEYVVSPQGKVAFPLVGDVQAGEFTVKSFSENLEKTLLTYVRNPRVSTEILVYRPFYILGQVEKPGTYPFVAGLTVANAAATAGGFTYRAETRRVYIKHAGEKVENEYVLSSETPVQPGDTVRIAERNF